MRCARQTRQLPAFVSSLLAICLLMPDSRALAELRAFSLKAAERAIRDGRDTEEVRHLGKITVPFAVVLAAQDDVVLVGHADAAEPVLTTDCVAAALRVAFLNDEEAGVSIDPTPDTLDTKRQAVHFTGGIERTSLGKAFLEADIVLKKLALGELDAQIAGVPSYLELTVDEARKRGADSVISGSPYARVWWYPDDPQYEPSDGIFAVRLGVGAAVSQTPPRAPNQTPRSEAREAPEADATFAQTLTTGFDDLAQEFPALARLKPLFSLLALSKLLKGTGQPLELEFWLREYRVQEIPTPEEYPLLTKTAELGGGTSSLVLRINGGVESRALLVRLRDGDISAVRDAVVESRPHASAVSWDVPISNWDPGAWLAEDPAGMPKIGSALQRRLGCSVWKDVAHADATQSSLPFSLAAYSPPSWEARLEHGLFKPAQSGHIGGVMLSGMAQIEGAERAEVSLAGGNFSLVVDGQNARIDPRLFRKFVTALWCVYYSEQAPGISIDPPARDPDEEVSREEFMKPEKHSVRYIGRVVHTDLGRVMREADYLMKKWAVGSGRPDYPGFRSVDGYSANLGVENVGVSRRFWFVPEDLRFRRGGDLLLFDAGRMRLLTEYDRDGMRGRASQADEAFASFFTEHYDGIGKTVPVYEELFEYAKLVSLAKYLKQQGVPLHWFLMANKDLVLMEDSPTEVDAFIKRSDHVRGIAMKGGVDLASTPSFRNDAAAEAAIRRALACVPAAAGHGGPAFGSVPAGIVPRNVSFEVAGEDYTVLPQHSLTSGKDHRGIRYQTDAALRGAGKPALELVRYFNPRRRESGQFGRGWHLLIPYRVEPVDGRTRPFLNVEIPERMAVENVLSGEQEVLAFSEGRDEAAGYVPQKPGASQIVKLYLMSDGSHRLADKLGNQFHFDPSGRMREMFLSPAPEHQMSVEYMDWFTATFVEPAYCARPVGEERVDFLNARIPRRVEVRDCVNDHVEELTFSADNEIPGYVPDDARASRFRVAALLANGGLEVRDQHGNRIRLTPGWDFDSILPAPERQMVRSVSMGGRRVTFGYTLDAQGQVVIATATVAGDARRAGSTWIVRYEYDDDGRLCRVRRPAGLSRPVLSAIHQEAAPKQAEQLARLERGRPDRMIPAGPETLAP